MNTVVTTLQTVLHCLPGRGHPGRGEDRGHHRGVLPRHDLQRRREARHPHLQTLLPQLSAGQAAKWPRPIYIRIHRTQGEVTSQTKHNI